MHARDIATVYCLIQLMSIWNNDRVPHVLLWFSTHGVIGPCRQQPPRRHQSSASAAAAAAAAVAAAAAAAASHAII